MQALADSVPSAQSTRCKITPPLVANNTHLRGGTNRCFLHHMLRPATSRLEHSCWLNLPGCRAVKPVRYCPMMLNCQKYQNVQTLLEHITTSRILFKLPGLPTRGLKGVSKAVRDVVIVTSCNKHECCSGASQHNHNTKSVIK